MDLLLLTLSILLILLGIIGCLLPIFPGPPLSFAGLVILEFTRFANFDIRTLLILGLATALIQVFDLLLPILGAKRFGGSKSGNWGSIIGFIAGLFLLPVLGPLGIITVLATTFSGAYIGEKITGLHSKQSLRAALGSFVGFIAGSYIKWVVSISITIFFIVQLIN